MGRGGQRSRAGVRTGPRAAWQAQETLLRKSRNRAAPPSSGRRARRLLTSHVEDSGSTEQPAGRGPKLYTSQQGNVPPHPHQGRELFQATSLPVDVVTGPGEPDGPVVIGESGV